MKTAPTRDAVNFTLLEVRTSLTDHRQGLHPIVKISFSKENPSSDAGVTWAGSCAELFVECPLRHAHALGGLSPGHQSFTHPVPPGSSKPIPCVAADLHSSRRGGFTRNAGRSFASMRKLIAHCAHGVDTLRSRNLRHQNDKRWLLPLRHTPFGPAVSHLLFRNPFGARVVRVREYENASAA